MVTHRNLKTNCERIVKDIFGQMPDNGIFSVKASKPLRDDFNKAPKKYINEINRIFHEKGTDDDGVLWFCHVTDAYTSLLDGGCIVIHYEDWYEDYSDPDGDL